jgi:hypothetical protein
MLPFGVTIPATVPQGSEIPEGLMNKPVLSGSVGTIKKHEIFISCCEEFGLAANGDKTKYMVTSRKQNAGRSHNMKIDYFAFEMAE